MRNQLLRALQAGVLSPDDLTESEVAELTGAPGTPQPRFDIPEVPMNSMRAESGPDAGKVTSLNFRDAAGRQAPGGMTWDALNASLAQQPPPEGLSWDDLRARTGGGQKRQMRVVGAGNGSTVDLSPEDAGPVALDYTRPPVDVPGVGKAYYSKDGRGAYVMGPDGQPSTKVILGYNQQGSMDLNKWFQDQRAKEAQIVQTQAETEKTREATAGLRAQNTMKEDTQSQAYLEKKFGKAEKGYAWTLDGRLVPIAGSPEDQASKTGIEGAKDTLRKIDEMIGQRDANGNLVQGSQPHKGFQDLIGATWKPGARFIDGTDAADFQARLDEVKGGAFLQAFNSLRGGGAITEVEGKKATDAITRMNRSQSEAEFVKAATEFRNIVAKGMERAQAARGGAPTSGTPDRGALIQQARDAIARGAPADVVKRRLANMGITDPI